MRSEVFLNYHHDLLGFTAGFSQPSTAGVFDIYPKGDICLISALEPRLKKKKKVKRFPS
jgi:hypothetical protein